MREADASCHAMGSYFYLKHSDEDIASRFLNPSLPIALVCKDGRNALLHAASGGNVLAAEYLLERGAPINAKSIVRNYAANSCCPNNYIDSGPVKSNIS
jgi:ankyrin repeat protein